MTCEDCVPCEGDGCDRVAYCLSQPGARPCAHDRALCDDCRLEECAACQAETRVSNRTHWLVMDGDRRVVRCHCGFPAPPDDDGYGDAVVDHIYRIGLAAGARRLRVVPS
jgi:hypothetical protein